MADTAWILQSSFSAGEVSPSMIARSDLPKLGMAALTLRNRTVLPHGPSEVRPGFEFINAAKYGDKKAVLRPFVFSTEQAYILEFGHLYVRMYKDGGIIYKPASEVNAWVTSTAYKVEDFVKVGSTVYRCTSVHTSGASTQPGTGASWQTVWTQDDTYEIATPYTENDVYDLNLTQSADLMYISHNKYPIQVLSRSGHATWQQSAFAFEGGPFMKDNLTSTTLAVGSTTGAGRTLISSVAQFQAGHVGSLWKIKHDVAGQAVSGSFSAAGQSSPVRGKGRWKVVTNGTWTGKVNLEMSLDGSTWTTFRSYSSANNANVIDAEDSDGLASYRLNCTTLTSGSITYDLTMQPHEWDGIVQITAVSSSTAATCTVIEELASTTATKKWAEGSWSDYRGWPSCSVFYQNRLGFAGTPAQPSNVWLSKSDDYTNFGLSDPLVDDDMVNLPLVTRKVNAIRSMVAMSELIAFTSGAQFRIDAASGGVITPSNAVAKPQEYYGIANVDPIVAGQRIIYVQRNGSIVRDLGYQFTEDKYVGNELTIMARHLVRKQKIVDAAFIGDPDNTLYLVRDDGMLLGLTYQRDQDVYAWHHHDTDGKFLSVAVIEGTDRNELWALIERTVNGQTVKYVERQAVSVPSDDVKDMFYLDAGLTWDAGPTSYVAGLTHLEGKTVNALADGFVIEGLAVTGGRIDLPDGMTASKVHIGLPYIADLETNDGDIQSQDGSTQGRMKTVANVILRLQDSRGGMVGRSFDLMDDLNYGNPEQYDVALPLFSGDVELTLPGSDYDTKGRVCIRQTQPLPLTVLAINREMKLGG